MKIGIVVPSWHYWADPSRIQPMWEMHFATVIENRFDRGSVSVEIIDLRGISLDQQCSHIQECDLYFYWIMKSGDYTNIEYVVKELRQIYPSAKHVAGGTHIEMCSEESKSVFDSVIKGAGENSFISIINNLQNEVPLKNLYQDEYENVHFCNFSYPKRHYLPKSAIVSTKQFEKYGSDIKATCVMFSRGCNMKCAYCVYNVPSKIQYKPLDVIADEIEYLKKEFQIEAINLKDEVALPFSKEFCHSYLETIRNSEIMWRGQTTIHGSDEKILKLAGESGCVELACGIESASPLAREVMNKKISDDKIQQFIENCHNNGIKFKMCLIIGLPGEPLDIVEQTIKFIEKMNPDFVSISGLDPFPGSEIFNNKDYYGIKYIDQDWGKHTHLLFRFSEKEDGGIPFEYEVKNRWGKTFSKKEIINNIIVLQKYCRDNDLTY